MAGPLARLELRLWLWWTLAGVLGFALGFGLAFGLLMPLVTASDWAVLTPLVASQVVVASIQWLVLRRYVSRLGWWVPATAAGALIGAALVQEWQRAVPRHLISVTAIQQALPPWFPLLTVIFILIALGVAMSVAVGQALVLRPVAGWKRASLWILAASVAAVVVTLLETGAVQALMRPIIPAALWLPIALAENAAVGAVSGIVTGAALVWILRGRPSLPSPALSTTAQPRRGPLIAGAALTLALVVLPLAVESGLRMYPPVSATDATRAVIDDLKRIHPDYADLHATSVRYVATPSKVYNSQGQLVASWGRGQILLLGFIPVPESLVLPPSPMWIVEFSAPAESFDGYELVKALTGELAGGGRTHY